MDELNCPICGREMKYYGDSEGYNWTCSTGHEEVKVSISIHGFPYVFLGAGCYLAGFNDEISSCERAISRMKLEYDCGKFMEHFYESSRPTDF